MQHPLPKDKPNPDLMTAQSGDKEERTRKLEELRREIDAGTYFVPTEAIAEKIIRYYTHYNQPQPKECF